MKLLLCIVVLIDFLISASSLRGSTCFELRAGDEREERAVG